MKNFKSIFFLLLFLSGLTFRIAGLFFNGMFDLDTQYEWGEKTRLYGLAESFQGIYFPLAYWLYGLASFFSQFIPHLWFLPFKSLNFFFDLLLLIALLKAFPQKTLLIFFFYWVHPWFIVEGCWLGYTDSPMAFFLLLPALFSQKWLVWRRFLLGSTSASLSQSNHKSLAPYLLFGCILPGNFF